LKSFRLLTLAAFLAAGITTAHSAGREIYPDPAQARGDLEAALKTATTHKRVLVDFGGNWCGDCQVLDIYMHNAQNLPLLDAGFIVVHVNIGSSEMEKNRDIAGQYQIPLEKGVPALAVLSDKGKLLYSQKTGEFEKMRHMESSTVTSFLVQWRPAKAGCSAVQLTC
jgi:thioredoxin 1